MQTGEIVVYQPDEVTRLEVRVDGEKLCLTQESLAMLSRHITSTTVSWSWTIQSTISVPPSRTLARSSSPFRRWGFPRRCLSDEVGHDRLFLYRVLDACGAAGCDAFEQPCHVAAEFSHDLHSLLVLKDLLRGASVHHVPVF